MSRKSTNPEQIGDVVKGLIQQLDGEGKPSEDKLLTVWKDIVGLEASQKSRPNSIYKKRLMVIVENPSWIQELNMNKRIILKKLQSRFGKEWIEDMRFQSAGS